MGSVPNSRYEISTRYGIRWFKCKLKPPKKGTTGFVTCSKKLTLWQSCCISLAWTNEWLPSKSRKPCHHGAVTTSGSVFPIFDSSCDRIWSLYSDDTQRGGHLHMLPSVAKYLTVKLTDNLISQSSTGGKSSFCKPKLAILQVSVHTSLKSVHCNHVTEKLLSDWLKCILKLPCQGRTLSLTQNRKRRRSIWLQRLCEYLKLSNVLVKTGSTIPKFYGEYLILHRSCWNVSSMKGLVNFPRKIGIIWESFSWFSYPVASMSDFHYNVSSRVFLFVDGPTWN